MNLNTIVAALSIFGFFQLVHGNKKYEPKHNITKYDLDEADVDKVLPIKAKASPSKVSQIEKQHNEIFSKTANLTKLRTIKKEPKAIDINNFHNRVDYAPDFKGNSTKNNETDTSKILDDHTTDTVKENNATDSKNIQKSSTIEKTKPTKSKKAKKYRRKEKTNINLDKNKDSDPTNHKVPLVTPNHENNTTPVLNNTPKTPENPKQEAPEEVPIVSKPVIRGAEIPIVKTQALPETNDPLSHEDDSPHKYFNPEGVEQNIIECEESYAPSEDIEIPIYEPYITTDNVPDDVYPKGTKYLNDNKQLSGNKDTIYRKLWREERTKWMFPQMNYRFQQPTVRGRQSYQGLNPSIATIRPSRPMVPRPMSHIRSEQKLPEKNGWSRNIRPEYYSLNPVRPQYNSRVEYKTPEYNPSVEYKRPEKLTAPSIVQTNMAAMAPARAPLKIDYFPSYVGYYRSQNGL